MTPSTGLYSFECTSAAGNIPSVISAARSEPACFLVPVSIPPQNLKHDNINVGYLVIILNAAKPEEGTKNYTNIQSKVLENDSGDLKFGHPRLKKCINVHK